MSRRNPFPYWNRQPRRLFQRAEHDRRARGPHTGNPSEALPQQLPKMLGIAGADLDQIAVFASHVVHFEHLRQIDERLRNAIVGI
jgi:hypothetical protein